MRIAIIGSGISGNMAAYLLSKHHQVTIFEKRNRPGGHSATVDIKLDNGLSLPVDTGFIVYNQANYPGLTQLFAELDVETQPSDMSFGFSQNNGALEWSGQSLATVFGQKLNIFRPRFWRMLRDIFRFNAQAREVYESGKLPEMSLGQWLSIHNYSKAFTTLYLYPMAAAIWSSPSSKIAAFPAGNLIQFFYNHRLIDRDRPKWRTVVGGSRNYVAKMMAAIASNGGELVLNADISKITRSPVGIEITDRGQSHNFDKIIFATHTDQTLSLLGPEASEAERRILSAISYLPNQVYLHRDESLMPQRKPVWSSWNYMATQHEMSEASDTVFVSYWMNRLQQLPTRTPLIVSLNPPRPPQEDAIYFQTSYDHPQFDTAAIRAQKQLPNIQGVQNTYFCGAWTGYGFHEDGLRSAVDICRDLDVDWGHRDVKLAAE
jgi:predicted NAD/FAD-binding protein